MTDLHLIVFFFFEEYLFETKLLEVQKQKPSLVVKKSLKNPHARLINLQVWQLKEKYSVIQALLFEVTMHVLSVGMRVCVLHLNSVSCQLTIGYIVSNLLILFPVDSTPYPQTAGL